MITDRPRIGKGSAKIQFTVMFIYNIYSRGEDSYKQSKLLNAPIFFPTKCRMNKEHKFINAPKF